MQRHVAVVWLVGGKKVALNWRFNGGTNELDLLGVDSSEMVITQIQSSSSAHLFLGASCWWMLCFLQKLCIWGLKHNLKSVEMHNGLKCQRSPLSTEGQFCHFSNFLLFETIELSVCKISQLQYQTRWSYRSKVETFF